MIWLIGPFKKYAHFTGRATRAEFWSFAAFFVAVTMAANYIDALDGTRAPVAGRFGMLELIVSLIFLLPILSCGTRRLHDTGRMGFWLMLLYAPYLAWTVAQPGSAVELLSLGGVTLGFVALVILLGLPGERQSNKYGSPV